MSTHRNPIAVVGLISIAAALPSPALAQATIDQSFNLQLFQPAVGPYSFLTLESADVPYHKQFALGFWLNYQHQPLVLNTMSYHGLNGVEVTTPLVARQMSGTLTGAIGFRDRYQFGIAVPITYGAGELDVTGQGESYYAFGLGDPRFDAKARLTTFGEDEELVVAVAGGFTLPIATVFAKNGAAGDGKLWMGDKYPTVNVRGLAEYRYGDWRFAGSLGVLARGSQKVFEAQTGSQLLYGAAAAYQMSLRTELIAELAGRTGLYKDWQYADANPYELDGAVRISLPKMTYLTVGAGLGGPVRDFGAPPWTTGIGAPTWRGFAAVTWIPDYRDSDRDGVYDTDDQCKDQPEDRDGFKDQDGCPDADNDGDGIDDNADKCLNDAEDFDQYQDEDGCPDLDNDNDGIPDIKDACPGVAEDGRGKRPKDGCPSTQEDEDGDGIPDVTDKCKEEPEDKDGFEDDDGCPDIDNDNDGIPDSFDTCPNEAEDFDSFEDEDGCLEADNDKDGFVDTQDKCPGQPETLNGVQDEDGCPDSGPELVQLTDAKIDLKVRIAYGWDDQGKTEIKEQSHSVLNLVVLVMRGHPEIRKVRIEVRSTGVQPAETQRRAEAVRDYLVSKGIDAARLTAAGAGVGSRTDLIIESTGVTPKKKGGPSDPAATPAPAAASGESTTGAGAASKPDDSAQPAEP